MGLEQEMERYGAFQESSPRASSRARPTGEDIGAIVTATEPCECIYRDLPEQKKYRIPGATEYPTVHRGILRKWIRNFHEMNGMELPEGFYKKNKQQLLGMFYGMCRNPKYGISTDKILKSQY